MASLNTLRTRGGIIISIVIGIALLAFLLGDIGPRSCSNTDVGSINGHTIGYEEYYFESENYQGLAQTMYNKDALSSEEVEVARENAWQSLVAKYAYRPGFKKLGLGNSEEEQKDMVVGQYLSPIIMGNFANPRTGIYEPGVLTNFLMQMEYDESGRLMAIWEYMKEQMNDQRTVSKYYALVRKGIYVTDLEVENSVAAANNSYDIMVAGKEYSSIADSLVQVSMADIKAYYNDHKGRYKQQPNREVEYVVFDLLPSDADYAAAETYINNLAAQFAESDNPMQFALLNSRIQPNQMYQSESEVEPAIAAALFNNPEAVYGPELNGDVYTIARLADSKTSPEELGAKHIVLAPNERDLADSLANAIRNGADIEMLAVEYSRDPSAQMNSGNLGMFNPEHMVPAFSNALIDARIGEVVLIDSDYGIHVAQLTDKGAPIRRTQIATIRYKIDPSPATQQEVYAEASKFLASAAGSYDNFKKAATEGALSKRVARIRNTDRSVTGLEDSRELVRWSFDNKKGTVSDVMELGGNYVVAALTEVRNDDYAKPEDLVDQIRPIVVRQKKADMILKEIQGTTFSQMASSLAAEPKEAEGVAFNLFVVDGVGFEPRLIGAVSALAPGQSSKPVKGETGVYVFEVTATNVDEEGATAESERVRIEATSEAYLDQRVEAAMNESAKIKDNRVRFF